MYKFLAHLTLVSARLSLSQRGEEALSSKDVDVLHIGPGLLPLSGPSLTSILTKNPCSS